MRDNGDDVRRMSFSLTVAQILGRSKTVTRRVGWRFLKPGDLIQAVERAQGLKKGEKVRKLAVLRVVDVRVELLSRLKTDSLYGENELPLEGFPCWTRDEFLESFCKSHGLKTMASDVTRIEFEYVED